MTTWEDNRKRIAGLWPQYAPTDDEKALFAERLGHRRQDWLEEALKRHRSEDHDGAYKPKLSRIIAHYDDIRQAGDASVADLPSCCRWRAGWEDAQGRRFAAAHIFGTADAALAFAETQGSRPVALEAGGLNRSAKAR